MFKSTKMAAPPPRVKVKNAIVSLLLVAALVITGALAFLTAKDSAENKFTVGNVEITLTEPLWDAANPDGTLENIVAGQVITKDPTITNTGVNDAYVYMMVQVPKADNVAIDGEVVSDHQLFSFTPNTGWKCIAEKTDDNDANNYYLYAFNTALAPEGTANLFDKVIFANTTSDFEASSLKIEIEAYAIQSDFYNGEATNAESAWNLYVNQSGWAFPSVDAPVVVPEGMSALNFVDEDGDVVHTEIAEVGSPVEMYFEPSLAKTGYTFDWVDENTGDVAYSGMPMPEEDTNLAASYTETGYGETASEFLNYSLCYSEDLGLHAVLRGLYSEDGYENTYDDNFSVHPTMPDLTQAYTVIIPAEIEITILQTTGKGPYYANYTGVDNYGYPIAHSTNAALVHADDVLSTIKNQTVKVPVLGISKGLDENNQEKIYFENAETIVLPDGFGYSPLSTGSFSNHSNLKNVVLPYGVKTVNTVFANCKNLSNIYISSSTEKLAIKMFENCTGLTEINVPKSLKSAVSFKGCTNIKSINYKSLDSFFTLGTDIYEYSPDVKVYINGEILSGSVDVPTTISEMRIPGYKLMTSVNIQNNITSFLGMSKGSGITEIIMPNSIVEMTGGLPPTLTNFVLSDNIISIPNGCFALNNNLTSIKLPSNLKQINERAFVSCTNLKSVYIPDTVTSISYDIFTNCGKLTDIYYAGTEEQWNAIEIDSSNTVLFSTTIHYNSTY